MLANIIHTYLFTKLIQQTPRFSQQTTRQRHPRRRPKQPSYTCCGRCEGDGKKNRATGLFFPTIIRTFVEQCSNRCDIARPEIISTSSGATNSTPEARRHVACLCRLARRKAFRPSDGPSQRIIH